MALILALWFRVVAAELRLFNVNALACYMQNWNGERVRRVDVVWNTIPSDTGRGLLAVRSQFTR